MDEPRHELTTTAPRGIRGYDWVPANDLIKVVAMALMVIDHVAWAFSRHPDPWRALGRGSFPLFAALLVAGVRRTRSPRRYLMRLALFALVSQYPFALCFEGLNIGFTLAIGGLALYVGEDLLERNRQVGHPRRGWLGWTAAMGAAGIVAGLLRTDYDGMGILAMALLQRSPSAGIGIPLLMGWMALFARLRHWGAAYWGVPVVGAVFLVGWALRGSKRRFLPRWIVYAFYPVHLTIIGIILAAWSPSRQSKQPALEPLMAAILESAWTPWQNSGAQVGNDHVGATFETGKTTRAKNSLFLWPQRVTQRRRALRAENFVPTRATRSMGRETLCSEAKSIGFMIYDSCKRSQFPADMPLTMPTFHYSAIPVLSCGTRDECAKRTQSGPVRPSPLPTHWPQRERLCKTKPNLGRMGHLGNTVLARGQWRKTKPIPGFAGGTRYRGWGTRDKCAKRTQFWPAVTRRGGGCP